MASFFANFDHFSKAQKHVQVKTASGGFLSLISLSIMGMLFVSELVYWRTTRAEDHIIVDKSLGDRDVNIEMELHFHALGCSEVNVISEDSKGLVYDASHTQLARTDTQPGCLLQGSVRVKGLPGHLHVSAQRSLGSFDGRMQYAVDPAAARAFNASHTFRRLSFGPAFPGQVSPLDGVSSAATEAPAAFQYHLRVVPTVYEPLSGLPIDSRQYSASDFVAEYDARAAPHVHPGLWLRYDFSPTMVRRVEVRRTFLQFLTSLCAILGGVFAISGLVDQVIHRATEKKD